MDREFGLKFNLSPEKKPSFDKVMNTLTGALSILPEPGKNDDGLYEKVRNNLSEEQIVKLRELLKEVEEAE